MTMFFHYPFTDVDDIGLEGILYVEFLFHNSFFLWQSYAGVDVDT
jgi:hypothetical protein